MKNKMIIKLKESEEENYLYQEIIKSLLQDYDNDEELKTYISDVLTHGCTSGICSELIYYKDTIEFYDKFEEEIEDLLEEYKESCGFNNRFETIASLNGSDNVGNITQEKNLLAWYGYEEIIRQIADYLEMEI